MTHIVVFAFALVACGGGAKKVGTTPVANSTGSVAKEPEPPPQTRADVVIARYKAYADTVCACAALPSDRAMDCVRAATDKYAKDAAPHEGEKPDPEEIAAFAKATEATTKQFTECITKIATAAAGSAATP